VGIEFRLATKTDKVSIKRFYKQQKYSAGFMGFDHTMLALVGESIIGAVIASKIEEHNSQYLLHGLVVSQHYRCQKIASSLIKQMTKRYAPIYCFADNSLTHFYINNGAKQSSEDELSMTLACRLNAYRKYSPTLNIFYLS